MRIRRPDVPNLVELVAADVPLTPEPLLGAEEKAIAPPGELAADAVRCPQCGYRNQPAWGRCYACGSGLEAQRAASGPPVKLITSFEEEKWEPGSPRKK